MRRIIAPSILSADFANLARDITTVVEAGAEWIHVDVMDGHFVPNLTIGAPVVASIRKATQAHLDVHLMIEKPERYVEDFAKAGSNTLTIHVESTEQPDEVLRKIRSLGVGPGITLRPRTPVESVLPYLHLVDLILVMTVEPGFGGQKFMSDQMSKVEFLARERERLGLDFHLEVDGGVDESTAKTCVKAGANVLVAGNYIFKNDPKAAVARLLKI